MKEIILSLNLAFILIQATKVNAQNSISSMFKNAVSSAKKTGKSVASNTSSKNAIGNITSIFSLDKIATKERIIGTWIYEEPAIVFESDNILKKMGGNVASSHIENNVQNYISKFGINKGDIKITFTKDGKFTQIVKGKTFSGTYTIKEKNIVMKYSGVVEQVIGTTQLSGNSLLIVMNTSKLLSYISTISKISGDKTLTSISSLLDGIDGMQCGLRFKK